MVVAIDLWDIYDAYVQIWFYAICPIHVPCVIINIRPLITTSVVWGSFSSKQPKAQNEGYLPGVSGTEDDDYADFSSDFFMGFHRDNKWMMNG